jgi:histidyl-tRNA synthetase
LVFGADELARGEVNVKNLADGSQQAVSFSALAAWAASVAP